MSDDPKPGDPQPPDPAVKQLSFERDSAKARAATLEKELNELKAKQPSQEQLARLQELEEANVKAEEERQRKAGEFDSLRTSLVKKHEAEIEAREKRIKDADEKADRADQRRRDLIIANHFANATTLFGPTGKTLLTADVASAYFRPFIEVQEDDAGVRVIVKDRAGNIIPNKNGEPAEFSEALLELIGTHPQRDSLLRGSGKTGSGSSGGSHDNSSREIDTTHLTRDDFQNPKVRDKVRHEQAAAGGLQVGRGFDRVTRRGA